MTDLKKIVFIPKTNKKLEQFCPKQLFVIMEIFSA